MLKKLIFLFLSFLITNISFGENNANDVITKEQRCQIAENNLRVLSDLSKPIYRRDINGNKVEMTYAEILKERQDSENLIKTVCVSNNEKFEQETRSFGATLINRAQLATPKDSITAALEQALILRDFNEVYNLLVNVIGIDDYYADEFINIAKNKTADEAIAVYNEKYKDKKAKDKNKEEDGKNKTNEDNEEQTADEFEKSIKNLSSNERVAKVKQKLAEVAKKNGWVKDNKLTKRNNRDVYRDPKDKKGTLYAVDTQHGRFEKLTSRGVHQGEVDIDGTFYAAKVDTSGGHNLIVK